jgi:error-prone DNA polymerase
VQVVGRVVRQWPPSAGGYLFLTTEDETGLVNLVVRPGVFRRYREALRNASLLLVEGQLQREATTFSVMVEDAVALR